MSAAQFSIGEVIKHRLFGYYGVIYDVDANFMGDEEWYDMVARTCPPKDQPWYRILVDDKDVETYVAERNLEACPHQPINHPLVPVYFDGSREGLYVSRRLPA